MKIPQQCFFKKCFWETGDLSGIENIIQVYQPIPNTGY